MVNRKQNGADTGALRAPNRSLWALRMSAGAYRAAGRFNRAFYLRSRSFDPSTGSGKYGLGSLRAMVDLSRYPFAFSLFALSRLRAHLLQRAFQI